MAENIFLPKRMWRLKLENTISAPFQPERKRRNSFSVVALCVFISSIASPAHSIPLPIPLG